MTLRYVVLVAVVLVTSVINTANAQTPISQSELARQLVHGNRDERSRAIMMAQALGAPRINPALRGALIAGLEREGRLHAQRRRGEIGYFENPELIAELARLVAEFRDPRSIPALAGALGTSPPAVYALAEFGEPAVQRVLDVVTRTEDGSVIMDALICLRLMAEGVRTRPLTPRTLGNIRRVAEQRLTGQQFVTTLWRAIDLAVALRDSTLRQTVQSLASNRSAVLARGITDPELIETTQKHAADRLAGVPPLPRR
jgi:hypothetical protein